MTTESIITLLTLWLIKPLLIIVMIFLGVLVLRKTSAALQHFWLASGVVAVLALPLLTPLLPALKWEILPHADDAHQQFWVSIIYGLVNWLRNPAVAIGVFAGYVFVASFLLFYFLLGLVQLRIQTRTARVCADPELVDLLQTLRTELGVERPVQLLTSSAVHAPQMWGLWRPVITLPEAAAQWSSERKLAVLIHELGHVARCDWAVTVLVKLVCAVFWFLPPIWWLVARLDQCAEMACDDFIYRLRDRHLAYAESLLAFATAPGQASGATPALYMAGHAPIFYRIQAILDQRRPHTPVAPEARQYWVLTLVLLLLPLAAVQLMPIDRTLLVRLLTVQPPVVKNVESVVDTEAATDRILLIDAASLQRLKPQLLVTELPRQHIDTPDTLIVTAELGVPESALEFAGILPDMVKPVIHMEGYMPLHTQVPIYPRGALQQAIEGQVTVRFTIAADGSVVDPEIIAAYPRRVFDRAVLTAVRQWRYSPQVINGTPVILDGVIERFTFQLEPAGADSRRR